MEVKQIYALINSVNKQLWGETAQTANDLSGLIALGNTVFSSSTNRDAFLNTLVDRIGKTIIRNLDLEVEFPNFLRNEMEFGCILQKINVQISDAQENRAWNIGDNGFTPNQFKIDKPIIRQSLFSKFVTWEYDLTVPDNLYRSAFTSASTMGSFIDGIMSAQSDALTLALNNLTHVSLCNFIAEKKKANNGIVDLLALYNTAYPSATLTADEATLSKEFYRFAGMIVRNYIGYLSEPSKLYNTDGMLRATARDNMHVLCSTDFYSAYTTMLSSDTFHDDLIKMPLFERYTTLQATGTTTPTYKGNTSISVIPSSEEGEDEPTTVSVNYVVCMLIDRQAIGTTYRDIYTGTDRNNRNRYTNYTTSATLGMFNDTSENAVIFVIGQ